MDDFAEQIGRLRQTTQQTRYQFLLTEADLVVSAIEFGTLELQRGNREVARKEAANACRGMETISKFLPQLDAADDRNSIQVRLDGLRGLFEEFERALDG
jgi:hypothetical protein